MTTHAIIAQRHVVSVSSGASSAVAAQRVINRYGKDSVDLVFADTQIEDVDNYRFLLDLQRHFDQRVHILVEGRTPYQVAEDEHIIPNHRIHPCTYRLKIVPMQQFVTRRQRQGYHIFMHIGMNIHDAKPRKDKPFGRLAAPAINWGSRGVTVDYPLLWEPVVLDSNAALKAMGLELPRMYRRGYTHANCGGECCAQGLRDWRRTLTWNRPRYVAREQWERQQRLDPVLAPYALLRDRSNNTVTPKTLEELRMEYEQASGSGQLSLFDLAIDIEDSACGVECGVGSDWTDNALHDAGASGKAAA